MSLKEKKKKNFKIATADHKWAHKALASGGGVLKQLCGSPAHVTNPAAIQLYNSRDTAVTNLAQCSEGMNNPGEHRVSPLKLHLTKESTEEYLKLLLSDSL